MKLNKTIPENFFQIAQAKPNKKALIFKKNGVFFNLKYGELARKVNELAASLQKMGIKKGDRIAILSNNRPEWVITDLAVLSIGGILTPIHSTLSPRIINYVLRHSESKILFVSDSSLLNKIICFQEELPELKKIVAIEEINKEAVQLSNVVISEWSEIIKSGQGHKIKTVEVELDDPASIIYTSGTTGDPKGVILTHRNFLSNAYNVNSMIPVKANDVFLSFLPLSHVLERTAGYYMPLLFGATIAYAEGYKQLPYNLRQVKPTLLISVPRVFERFHDIIWDQVGNGSSIKRRLFYYALKQEEGSLGHALADKFIFNKVRKRLGGRLRLAISGGAGLDPKIGKFFHKLGILILEGYGLTETSPVIAVNQEDDNEFGTVGYAVPNTEIKISEHKEIMVKGPNVMAGYFKDEESTNDCLNAEGWLKTGDLGFLDKNKRLIIIGRRKEMMVTSYGKNIWPEPVEQKLNLDRFISQSMLIAHNQKFPAALLVPDWKEIDLYLKRLKLTMKLPEEMVNDPEIINLFNERLEKINENLCDHEKIKKYTLLLNDFSEERDELTPTMKLRRHVIEKHYKKEIERMFG